MKSLHFCIFVATSLALNSGMSQGTQSTAKTIFDERTWTSADGSSSFVGILTKLDSGKVTIEKDGEPLTFSVEKLSPADREFLGQRITITTLDGVEHTDVSISRIGPDSVSIRKPNGIATIAMVNLPEALAARLGFDAEEAKAKMAAKAETAQKAAVRNKAGFALTKDQEAAIIANVKSQGATDAAIGFKDDSINLAFGVPFGTTKEQAKQIGENFVRLTMSLSNDSNPDANLVKGEFSYMVGAYTPDQKWLVMGHKRATLPKITW